MKKAHVSASTSVLPRPPIIVVVGHVDHGKTTLLDFIRKSHVADREHGGITQHIGAYQIDTKGQIMTFIDTPGHVAFARMRSRGAHIADIAILVVACDDSVKPQTVESIAQVKEAKIPIIVAANKTDLPTANLDRVKKDLAKAGVQVEGFGGDVPLVAISAKTGSGVEELLDMIQLVLQLSPISAPHETPLSAAVIETKVNKGQGPVASIIITSGTLADGMSLYTGELLAGKVRAMFNERGQRVTSAVVSQPVEILGLNVLPPIGSMLSDSPKANDFPAKEVAKPESVAADALPDFLKPLAQQEKPRLKLVLKADSAGSLEAIVLSLDERIHVVFCGVGDVSEADILEAKSVGAFVIGFGVKASTNIEKLAQTEKVILRTYTIIYKLLEELHEVAEGIKEVITKERELGSAVIIAEFPFNGERIAGCKVTSGRIARGDSVKLVRDEEIITRGKIKSIRKGKEDITKAETPSECGVLFDKTVDFLVNDAIIAVIQI